MGIGNVIRKFGLPRHKKTSKEVICTHETLVNYHLKKRDMFEKRCISLNGTDVCIGMFVRDGWLFSTNPDGAWGTVMWVNPDKNAQVGERVAIMINDGMLLNYNEAVEYSHLYAKHGIKAGQAFLLSEKDWNMFKMDDGTPYRPNMEANGIYRRRKYWTADECSQYTAKMFTHLCYTPDDDGRFYFSEVHKSNLCYAKIAVKY